MMDDTGKRAPNVWVHLILIGVASALLALNVWRYATGDYNASRGDFTDYHLMRVLGALGVYVAFVVPVALHGIFRLLSRWP